MTDEHLHPAFISAVWSGSLVPETLEQAQQAIALQHEWLDTLWRALIVYADPSFYHACTFWFDPPTGGFDQDFSEDYDDSFYERPMPGKLARQALHDVLLSKTPEASD